MRGALSWITAVVLSCSNMSAETHTYLPIEGSLGDSMNSHIRTMHENCRFQELGVHDLFHAHLLTYSSTTRYESLEEFLDDVAFVLYHTDELRLNWTQERESLHPRSFIGALNGRIIPARDVIPRHVRPELSDYVSEGTIHHEAVRNVYPFLENGTAPPTVDIDGKQYVPNFQISILPSPPDSKDTYVVGPHRFNIYIELTAATAGSR